MVSESDFSSPPPSGLPVLDPIYLRDFSHASLSKGVIVRIRLIRAAARAIHSMWREGYDLADFSPMLWRFYFTDSGWHLSIPPHGLRKSPESITLDQLTRRFARWRLDLLGVIDENIMTRFMVNFLKHEPLEPGRTNMYLQEITDVARRQQPRVLKEALIRYTRRGSATGTMTASAEYLADRRVSLLPDTTQGEHKRAREWLIESIARGSNWYGTVATWTRQLNLIDALGFDITERPLLHQLWLLVPHDGSSFGQAYFQPTAFTPRRRSLFGRRHGLADELEEEVHRLRRSMPTP